MRKLTAAVLIAGAGLWTRATATATATEECYQCNFCIIYISSLSNYQRKTKESSWRFLRSQRLTETKENKIMTGFTAAFLIAGAGHWTRASANRSASTVLSLIATPRSALCLRVSCKMNKNQECETLSPLHHRFGCKFPRIPKKPRKMES